MPIIKNTINQHNTKNNSNDEIALILVFKNPNDVHEFDMLAFEEQRITTKQLYGKESADIDCMLLNSGIVKILYLDGMLVIKTTDKVDVLLTGNNPAIGIHIETAGGFAMVGELPVNLKMGIYVKAAGIVIDLPIVSDDFISLISKHNPTSMISMNSSVTTDKLKLDTYNYVLNANLTANSGLIRSKKINIQDSGVLQLGSEVHQNFKASEDEDGIILPLTSHSWRRTIVKEIFRLEKSIIISDEIKCKGIFNVNGAELHLKKDICFLDGASGAIVKSQIFADKAQVSKKSVIAGSDTYISIKNNFAVDGAFKINRLTLNVPKLTVTGVLWGHDWLRMHISDNFVNHGVSGSDETTATGIYLHTSALFANDFAQHGIFVNGGLIGRKILNINFLSCIVVAGGYLYGHKTYLSNGLYVNMLGAVITANFVNKSLINESKLSIILPFTLNIPKIPRSFKELCSLPNLEAILRISQYMGGNIPLARCLIAVINLGVAAKYVVEEIYKDPNLYNQICNAKNFTKKTVASVIETAIQSIALMRDIIMEEWDPARVKEFVDILLKVNDVVVQGYMLTNYAICTTQYVLSDVKNVIHNPNLTLQKVSNYSMTQAPIIDCIYGALLFLSPSIYETSLMQGNGSWSLTGTATQYSWWYRNNGSTTIALASSVNAFRIDHNKNKIYSHQHSEAAFIRNNNGKIYANKVNLSAEYNNERGETKAKDNLTLHAGNNKIYKNANLESKGSTNIRISKKHVSGGTVNIQNGMLEVQKTALYAETSKLTAENITFGYHNSVERNGVEKVTGGSIFIMKDEVNSDTSTIHHNNIKAYTKDNVMQDGALCLENSEKITDGKTIFATNSNTTAIDVIFESQQGNVFNGKADLKNVIVYGGNSNELAETSTTRAKNVHFIADNFNNKGDIEYTSTLQITGSNAESTTASSILKIPGAPSSFGLNVDTQNMCGVEHHENDFEIIANVSAEAARDLALGVGDHARKVVDSNISVHCEDSAPIEYAGNRVDGAHMTLTTQGEIILPVQYERAREKRFNTYAEADAFIKHLYKSYNLPPPPKIKKPWHKRAGDWLVKTFAEYGEVAAVAVGCLPIPGSQAAGLAIEAAVIGAQVGLNKHDQNKVDRIARDQQQKAYEQSVIDRKLLSEHETAAYAALAEEEHYANLNAWQEKLLNKDNVAGDQTIIAAKFTAQKEIIANNFAIVSDEINKFYNERIDSIRKESEIQKELIARRKSGKVVIGTSIDAGTNGFNINVTSAVYTKQSQALPRSTTIYNHDITHDQMNASRDLQTNETNTAALPQENNSASWFPEFNNAMDQLDSKDYLTVPFLQYSKSAALPDPHFENVAIEQLDFSINQHGNETRAPILFSSVKNNPGAIKQQNNIKETEKSLIRKFAELWEPLDEDFHTEFYDRKTQRTFEVKVLAGTTAGVIQAAVAIPFQTLAKLLASAEEFDSIFNADALAETHDVDQTKLLNKYKAQHDSISLALAEFRDALNHPANTAFKSAYNFGQAIFDLANTPEDMAFESGKQIGHAAMNARYMLFSASALTSSAKWALLSGQRVVTNNYEFRFVIGYTHHKGYHPRVFIRPKGKYLEPTTLLPGWGERHILSQYKLMNPVPATWEHRDMITFYAHTRKPHLDVLESIDPLSIKDLHVRKKFNKAVSQVRDHMTPGDLCACYKEREGIVIYNKHGEPAKHSKEFNDAENSINNFLGIRRRISPEDQKIVEVARHHFTKAWEEYLSMRELHKISNKNRLKS